jgi:hypothetical protein|mmetsp:Transcript_5818/g.12682  ORF Transcript_5818/g.12682 Transcript_5818/m.12682 type:complete len:155 (+) Transcript_5818:115-579(+)
MNIWPFRRHSDGRKNQSPPLVKELRIATSGSYSIKASIEALRVDGAGSYAQAGRVRAALFAPLGLTTIQFHADSHKKPGMSARASCVHVVQMFTPVETTTILDDAKRIGAAIGWCATLWWRERFGSLGMRVHSALLLCQCAIRCYWLVCGAVMA